MRKLILALLTASVGAVSAVADQCYTYTDSEGFPVYGVARRVSPNGQWVVGADDIDQTGAFVINLSAPDTYTFTDEGLLLDVNDSGVAVGTWFRKEGYAKYYEAAVYRDGEWIKLPLPEEVFGQSTAVAITADSKIIGGHAMGENDDPDEPGKYFPIVWKLNEATGQYEILKFYNDLWLPGTYGFFVQDMSPDAKWICGTMGLDMGDNIEVLLDVEKGELKRFHDIYYREREFTTLHPKTGEPITFVASVMHIDDMIDGFDTDTRCAGMFVSCNDKYVFGCRDVIHDVQEDGSAKITTYSTVYDIANDKFIDGASGVVNLTGDSPSLQFTNGGNYVYAGRTYSVNSDFDTAGTNIAGIYGMDAAGKVLSGSYIYYSPIGEMVESPVVLILDTGLSSIQEVGADPDFTAEVTVEGGRITVSGAEDVTIFSLDGKTLTRAHSIEAPAGVYIIMADGHSAKVAVK